MTRRRLDQLLVERGLFDSRARARAAIEAGGVRVDGRTAKKASEAVPDGAEITAEAAHPYVSRAALKLVQALDAWPVRVEGRVVLDVGASTGGFTEACLQRGARRVFAVDVGHGQLHPRLAADPRVTSLERTDARTLTHDLIDEAPQLVVCDASFIGLAKVLPAALRLAGSGADLVALVKPQFEAGPDAVGKGGVVRDATVRERALNDAIAFLQVEGWRVNQTAPCETQGADGNQEWLVWATRV
ncbi:TlyA family RNA methyltransferase [Brevundimonas sp. 2R-24]|uniref:TlyA family RNA methyltransferase n=1 Tax=Peiella sedimenti TaxID=3061083 RepID=A0ABT8SMD3_9CAUL|nr:TlyA family RNA methyltransferase [Caulobacteraceae bacterium XZ-24]